MTMDNSAAVRAGVEEEPSGPIGIVAPGPEPAAAPEWGLGKKILFRFAFVYLVLYSFPFPLDYVPLAWIGKLFVWYSGLWESAIRWVGPHLFHVSITATPNGSGDTTYNYVEVFCHLVVSVAAVLVWSLLDRRRRNYARLYDWLYLYTRFVLAAAMISYGAFKIIPSQFPSPAVGRLMQPFGDSSPMGLLWTFMGASAAYTIFAGSAEMLGGLLLVFRRTALLGGLVAVGAMTNVVVLNFSYDVPVKLYSSHLLLMAVFLVLPHLDRLANVFVLNRPAPAADLRPLFHKRWLRIASLVVWAVFVVYVIYFSLNLSWTNLQQYGRPGPKGPMQGLWNVEEYVVDGQAHPPLITDETRWRRLALDYPGSFSIQLMNDTRQRYNYEVNMKTRLWDITKRNDPNWKTSIRLQHPQPDVAILTGKFDGHQVQAKMHRIEPPKFLLMTRGFHWINEYPFNR
jgi:hypothetical protein